MRNYLKIKTIFILSLIFIGSFIMFIPNSNAKISLYNAYVTIDMKWADEFTEKPIIPRNEIADLKIKVIMSVDTGLTYGAGLYDFYHGSNAGALINLTIIDYPSWCSASLQRNLYLTNISYREEINCSLYVVVNENAPAYEEGIIKIKVVIADLGFIKGDSKIFNLTFKPAFFPLIRTDLPEINTKRINPNSEAIFPIEIENAGNAETKVLFEVLNIPKDWTATVTDFIILNKEKGSKGIAYLTIRPSRSLGYHFDEFGITLKILPVFAYDINVTGTPIYATFLIENRGFSGAGLEFYTPIAIIILIIIILIYFFYKKNKNR